MTFDDQQRRLPVGKLHAAVVCVMLALASAAPSGYAATLQIVSLGQAAENGGTATIAVQLIRDASDPPLDCQVVGTLSTIDGTATAPADYQTFASPFDVNLIDPAVSVEQQFSVPITDDTVGEATETFDALLTNIDSAACALPLTVVNAATVTILDNDPPDVGGALVLSGSAGQTASATFAVNGAAPFTLSAQLGNVAPPALAAPGNATYSFDVPGNAATGTTFNDTITVIDAGGTTATLDVTIRVDGALADLGALTPNQAALATYLDNLCPQMGQSADTPEEQDLASVCTNLTDPATTTAEAVAALDALSGEQLIGAADMVLRLMGQQHGNLGQRINALRSGATGLDLSGLNLNVSGQQISGAVVQSMLDEITGGGASADDFGRWGLFIDGRVNFGDKNETTDQPGFDFDTIGITVGIDYRLRDNFIIGGSLGYTQLESNFDHSLGTLDVDAWNGTLFATYFVADQFYVDALLSYGDSDYDSVRHIEYTDAGGTVQRTAKGRTDGAQGSAGLSSGFDFNHGAWTFGPHAGTYYANVDTDELQEHGAAGLNLIVGDQNAKSFTLNGGAHVSRVFTPAWGVLIPHLRVDLVHEFEDSRERVTMGFAADPFSADPLNPSPSFTLQTDKPDRDYVVWSAGLSAQFINGMAGFLNYQATQAYSDLTLAEFTYGLRWERTF